MMEQTNTDQSKSINIVFFASLKEALGIEQYTFQGPWPMTIKELKESLSTQLEKGEALLSKGVQSSIDFEFARDGDKVGSEVNEVAFFPPVTGG